MVWNDDEEKEKKNKGNAREYGFMKCYERKWGFKNCIERSTNLYISYHMILLHRHVLISILTR